jgi:hypothetical protein
MSFRCEICSEAQPPRTQPKRVVTKTKRNKDGHGETLKGFQIVEEKLICSSCSPSVADAADGLRHQLNPYASPQEALNG